MRNADVLLPAVKRKGLRKTGKKKEASFDGVSLEVGVYEKVKRDRGRKLMCPA